MNYPGNQATARLDTQQRQQQPGEHPSGPIGPLGPIRETFADGEDGLPGYDGYTLPSRGRRARHAGPGDGPEPGNGQPGPGGPPPTTAPSAPPVPRQGYGGPAVPRQGYGTGPAPRQSYGTGAAPRQSNGTGAAPRQSFGTGPVLPEGYSGNPVPHQGYGTDPAPRRGRRRHAADGNGEPTGAPGGPAGPAAPAAAPRRGPAHGYPPRAGDRGPQYPQGQFAAWNEAQAATQPRASTRPPIPLMASAPTWADTGEADVPPADGGGVALAERPARTGDRSEYSLRERRGGFGDHALLDRRGDPDGYSDNAVAGLAPSFAEVTSLVTEAPVITDPPGYGRTAEPERGRTAQTARRSPAEGLGPATRSRADVAKERNAVRRKGRRRKRVLIAGVCVVAVAAAGALAYLRHPWAKAGAPVAASLAVPPPAPSAKSSPQSLGQWQHIGTRAEDPTPLTLSQLFPAKFPADGTEFAQTAQLASTKCAKAVFGKQLESAVRNHSCSQVMRASYLSTKHKLMGTIGVLNLGTSAGASAVGKVTGSGEFIAQLTAHSGPTHNLAKGTGLEEAEVKGHYLIMTWVEFSTLHAPKTSAQKTQLRTFSADLIQQTANVSLTTRMVTGSPQMP